MFVMVGGRFSRFSSQALAKVSSTLIQYKSKRLLCSGSQNLAMANVTRSNFGTSLEQLRSHVRDADFISIDLEMTGITSAPWRENFELDTLDVRYLKLKDSAEKFAVVQFGVCPFRWDSTSGRFLAYPYNFYIFPRKELSINMPSFDFLCQTTSIEFLAKHHFNFNTCIYEGISYLSKQQEAEARVRLGLTEVQQSELCNSGQNLPEVKEIPLCSTADVLFLERMKNNLGIWRHSLLRDQQGKVDRSDDHNIQIGEFETGFYKRRPSFLLNRINSHQVKLVQQALRKHFKDLVYVEVNDGCASMQKLVVYTLSEEDRELLRKELGEERHLAMETQVEQAVGFRHVIDLIASAGKIIVGHNCLLDFSHIHSKFIAALPPTVVEFAASLHRNFPYIVDTKYLLTAEPTLQRLMKNKSTALSFAFAHMCGQVACTSKNLNIILNSSVNVVVPTELQRYTDADSGAKHEAGYDAFMTGCIFAQACHHLDIDFTNIHSSSELAEADKLQKYMNLLHLGGTNHVMLDLIAGGEAMQSRPLARGCRLPKVIPASIVLIWGFPAGYGANDLRGLVSSVLGSARSITGIFFLDESCAFVRFRNENDAGEFLRLMEDTMAAIHYPSSIQNCLATLLESGCINAAGYDVYEQICKSSLSRLIFSEQAEASGIRWKIKFRQAENKKVVEDVTKRFELDYKSGTINEETLHDHFSADRIGTLKEEERLERSFPSLSEERFLDSVCTAGPAFAKRSRNC